MSEQYCRTKKLRYQSELHWTQIHKNRFISPGYRHTNKAGFMLPDNGIIRLGD
jgi:hypothetical protein